MIEVISASDTGCRIQARPNRSLSDSESRVAFAIIASACLAVSLMFAAQGYWMPLPFAGLEVLVLAASMSWIRRRARQLDEIELSKERVAVCQTGPGLRRRIEFHPGWLRVELRTGRHQWYPRRLVLASHGQELEIGSFLNETDRARLAEELTRRLRPVSAWPRQ